jgi:hypothetical protein
VCANPNGGAPTLRVLDTTTFVQLGSVRLPAPLTFVALAEFAYLGGDAVGILGHDEPLRIARAPIIGSPP